MIGWLKKIGRISLLLLFVGYYASITFFPHLHTLANGTTYVHSHPFNKGPKEKPVDHRHTKSEITLIHFLSTFFISGTFILLSVALVLAFIQAFTIQKKEQRKQGLVFFLSNGLRAPPRIYTSR